MNEIRLNQKSYFSEAVTVLIALGLGWILYRSRLHGFGSFFDGAEYSTHILSGGIAHAPGYPLYLLMGKFLSRVSGDPIEIQQWISFGSLGISAIALYMSLRLDGLHRCAICLTLLILFSSYYVKLYTIIPEVFILNLALFSCLGWALSAWYYSRTQHMPLWIGLLYGLGASHHHTLVLTLPAFIAVAWFRRRAQGFSISAMGIVFGLIGFMIGALPLLYLFYSLPENAPYTYFYVQSWDDFFFVFLRKAYGTWSLSKHGDAPLWQVCLIFIQSFFKNFGWNFLFFIPLIVGLLDRTMPASQSEPISSKEITSKPTLIFALMTILVFCLVFLPNVNLNLDSVGNQSTLLRFFTIPFFLLLYPLAFSIQMALLKFTFVVRGRERLAFLVFAGVIGLSNVINFLEFQYQNFKILDWHIQEAYRTIFSQSRSVEKSFLGESYYQCVIYTQPDSLIYSVNFYNQFIAEKKCFVFSIASFAGHFRATREERLQHEVLGDRFIEEWRGKSEREIFKTFFTKLIEQGYRVYLLNRNDYGMFLNSGLKALPAGNVFELVVASSQTRVTEWSRYLDRLEPLLAEMSTHPIPTRILDDKVSYALFQNLIEYPTYFPDQIMLRERNDRLLEEAIKQLSP